MSNVVIDRIKIDILANAIADKSGEPVTMTLDEMVEAVDSISTGGGAISVVDTTDTAGGTIRTITAVDISDTTAVASDVATGKYFYTADGTKTAGTASGGGGDSWSAYGKNPTLVQTALNEKVYLKDTPFASWTPTTTSTKMSDVSDLTSYTTPSFNNYDYVGVYKVHTHFEYGVGATNTAKLEDSYYTAICFVVGDYTSYEAVESYTANTTAVSSTNAKIGLLYYGSTGVLSWGTSFYGYYVYSFTNPTAALSSITLKKPQMNARCSSSTFSTANASAVDMDNSYCEMKIELWQVDRGTSAYGKEIAMIHDMYEGNF